MVTKEHNTREMYDNVIEKHLSFLGTVKLHDVDRIHLQWCLIEQRGKIVRRS